MEIAHLNGEPPLFVLGVRRSGTTLLRVMLDRHPMLAIPDESYFIPQLAARHRRDVDVAAFLDDLRRLPTLQEWGVSVEEVAARLRPPVTLTAGISAVYEVFAAKRGKARWGDKTPMYMQHLSLLERLFPDALYLHLIRDGRDAALSFLQMPEGVVTRTWAHPRSLAGFACQWRTEVRAARRLGRRAGVHRYLELRYESLVADPERELQRACAFAGLAYEPAMLEYADEVDVRRKPHQQSLRRPPTPGLRDWRREMSAEGAREFEGIAGDVLSELGYKLSGSGAGRGPSPLARARLATYAALGAAWRAAGYAVRRSPLWERRHPPLT